MPYINEFELNRYNKSKLKIGDQWATHPTIDQRIKAIKKLNIPNQENNTQLSITVFQNFNRYAEKFTSKIFPDLKEEREELSESEFLEKYKSEAEQYEFSKIFNSYYDNKNPVLVDFQQIKPATKNETTENLFSDEAVSLVYEKAALENDEKILKQISQNELKIKTFDYDGVKYRKADAPNILSKINNKLQEVNRLVSAHDALIYSHLLAKADVNEKIKLENLQQKFNTADKEFDVFFENLNKFVPHLKFYADNTSF